MNEPQETQLKPLWLALPLLLMSGCERQASPEPDAVPTFQGKLDNTSCGSFTLNGAHPVDGTVFEYQMLAYQKPMGVRLLLRLGASQAGQQSYQMTAIRPGEAKEGAEQDDQTMQSVGGIIYWQSSPAPNHGAIRRRSFETDPADAIAGLKIGDSTIIPSRETSRMGGVQKTVETPIQVSFLGCSQLEYNNKPVNAAVYQVTTTYRSVSKLSKQDQEKSMTEWVYYWPEKGWWIRRDSQGHITQTLKDIQIP